MLNGNDNKRDSLVERYTPENLSDFIGNRDTIRELYRSVMSGSGNRCNLITGPSGVGKSSLVHVLAKKIQNYESVKQIRNTLNYREYNGPEFKGVDDVKRFVGLLQKGIRVDKNSISFYDEFHEVTKEAQSIMLKPVSDLSEGMYIFLATSEPHKLLKALIGRCTRHHLEAPPERELIDFLDKIARKEGTPVGLDILEHIALLNDCTPRDSLNTLERIMGLRPERQRDLLHSLEKIKVVDRSDDSGNRRGQRKICHVPTYSFSSASDVFLNPRVILKAIESITCTSEQLLERQFNPLTCYIGPFVSEGALIMVFAPAGVGKTWFTMYLSLLLTRQGSHEHCIDSLKIENQCGVVIIDGEMRTVDLQERLAAMASPMGDENADGPLTVLTGDDFFVSHKTRVNISDPDWREAIFLYMVEHTTNKVLILDNLSALAPGLNENSKDSWDPVNQWLLALRSLGVAVIIVHHSNKGGNYRGHSGRIDSLDYVVGLERVGAADELCFRARYEKFRSTKFGTGESFVMKGMPHPDNEDWLIWEQNTHVKTDEPEDSQICEEIKAHAMLKNKSQIKIGEQFNVSQSQVSKLYQKAKSENLVTDSGEITEDGMRFLEKFNLESTIPNSGYVIDAEFEELPIKPSKSD